MCVIVIIASVVSLNCPAPVATTEEAARLLKPREFIAAPVIERRAPVVLREAPPRTPAPQARETEQGRANRMGIPGGWTPLEWAILHGGTK